MKRREFKILGIEIRKPHIIALAMAIAIIALSLLLLKDKDTIYFILGLSFILAGLPFFISIVMESRSNKEKEEMFLEFSRNLVESVKAGTPISKSIINIKDKNYGVLNPYITKLANQITLGIPIKTALETFARDIGSSTIQRSVTIISETENAGGEIEQILDSVVRSVTQIEKLRKERKNVVYALTVEGYIIFIIFLLIMLIMQFKILPIATGLGDTVGTSSTGSFGNALSGVVGGEKATPEQLTRPFLMLIIVQGFFTGLVIGKLSEGYIKSGLKHSFILISLSILINFGARAIL